VTDRDERWPRVDVRDPGVPPERQDRRLFPVPDLVLVPGIFRDLTSPRDRVYNR
jgi:hypothetical protein